MKKSDMPAWPFAAPASAPGVLAPIVSTIVAGLMLIVLPGRAQADLTVCNQTRQPAGVALAMKADVIWKSEGWWTIEPGRCKALLKGRLARQDYYLHAVHYNVGGRWEGEESFCVDHGSFSIEGRLDCETRGYKPAGFLKIDTRGKSNWQHTLVDYPEPGPQQNEKE